MVKSSNISINVRSGLTGHLRDLKLSVKHQNLGFRLRQMILSLTFVLTIAWRHVAGDNCLVLRHRKFPQNEKKGKKELTKQLYHFNFNLIEFYY
ncbi:hypothetical protein WN51_12745 [Melipona quadrifasciata]|uniref:Uncharacterized protein n=1 Tax=Melipona quadrifasciata TaxID=166423 RepID=A0A0M9A394_9HYME|nr:hypothetical protein WN51_12745 [Melipona quadrifasciata]